MPTAKILEGQRVRRLRRQAKGVRGSRPIEKMHPKTKISLGNISKLKKLIGI